MQPNQTPPNPTAPPQTPTPNSGTPSPASPQDVLKSIRMAGTWAVVVGVLYILLAPLIELLAYKPSGPNDTSKGMYVLIFLLIGLILGGIFIGLGLKLRKTRDDDIAKADKLLKWLIIYAALVIIGNFVTGGGSGGILNILVMVMAILARSKIGKLKKAGTI